MTTRRRQPADEQARQEVTVISMEPGRSTRRINWTTYSDWLGPGKVGERWRFPASDTFVLLDMTDDWEISPGAGELSHPMRFLDELLRSDKSVVIAAPAERMLHGHAASRFGYRLSLHQSSWVQKEIVSPGVASAFSVKAFNLLRNKLGFDGRYGWEIDPREVPGTHCLPGCELEKTREPVIVMIQGQHGFLALVPCAVPRPGDRLVLEICAFLESIRPEVVRVRLQPVTQDPAGAEHLHTSVVSCMRNGRERSDGLTAPYTRVLMGILAAPGGTFSMRTAVPKSSRGPNPYQIHKRLNAKLKSLAGVSLTRGVKSGLHEVSPRLRFEINACPVENCSLMKALKARGRLR